MYWGRLARRLSGEQIYTKRPKLQRHNSSRKLARLCQISSLDVAKPSDGRICGLVEVCRSDASGWRYFFKKKHTNNIRAHNDKREPLAKVAFYGLDLYSLFSSMSAVISYLQQVSPSDARKATKNYGLFDRFQGKGIPVIFFACWCRDSSLKLKNNRKSLSIWVLGRTRPILSRKGGSRYLTRYSWEEGRVPACRPYDWRWWYGACSILQKYS